MALAFARPSISALMVARRRAVSSSSPASRTRPRAAMCRIVRRLPSLERVVSGCIALMPALTFSSVAFSTCLQKTSGVMFQSGASPRTTRSTASRLLWRPASLVSYCSRRDSAVCSSLWMPMRSELFWSPSFSSSVRVRAQVALRPCASPVRRPSRSALSHSARSTNAACSAAASRCAASLCSRALSRWALSSLSFCARSTLSSISRSSISHCVFWSFEPSWFSASVERPTSCRFFSGTCFSSSVPSRRTTQASFRLSNSTRVQ
mmetsp:Transcript_73218/g.214797  ORF Transcript_73218/g.214797 Transcript_73218/m.214797 type:complete len:264 (-) Transcript_73218:296-1087(-)